MEKVIDASGKVLIIVAALYFAAHIIVAAVR